MKHCLNFQVGLALGLKGWTQTVQEPQTKRSLDWKCNLISGQKQSCCLVIGSLNKNRNNRQHASTAQLRLTSNYLIWRAEHGIEMLAGPSLKDEFIKSWMMKSLEPHRNVVSQLHEIKPCRHSLQKELKAGVHHLCGNLSSPYKYLSRLIIEVNVFKCLADSSVASQTHWGSEAKR